MESLQIDKGRETGSVVPQRDEDRHDREYPAVGYHDAVDGNGGTALMRYIGRFLGFLWWILFWWLRDERHAVPERYEGCRGREYPALRYHDAVDGN